jgi:hypothetical protein
VRLLLYTDGKPTVGIRRCVAHHHYLGQIQMVRVVPHTFVNALRLAELLEVREQKMTKLGPSAKVAVFAYGENHDVKVLKYDQPLGSIFPLPIGIDQMLDCVYRSICNNYSSLYFAVTDQSTCE